jgi:hypothetical protein
MLIIILLLNNIFYKIRRLSYSTSPKLVKFNLPIYLLYLLINTSLIILLLPLLAIRLREIRSLFTSDPILYLIVLLYLGLNIRA